MRYSEERVVEVLQVNEKEIEEELEQIKRNAEGANIRGSSHSHPTFQYDPLEDVPTLPPGPGRDKKDLPRLSFEYPESLTIA